ncbi:MAG: peptidase prolyl oligopeptidase domain protein beta-propeller [Candidatus Midichloriaceae bacterium]|jgi:oligopeptidase B|nr:peptidase prolyl oligopeptidase domain protein beta-propeller [Candidatus Midichloriaceae bacterium]
MLDYSKQYVETVANDELGNIAMEKNYSWVRDANWPNSVNNKILDCLHAENKKCEEFFSPLQGEVDSLFAELKARIKEDDSTVPVKVDDYYYYSYIKSGQDYWTHARKHESLSAQEEILLDENLEAVGKDFFHTGDVEASKNHNLLAYSVDLDGSERYQIFIKDIQSNKLLDNNVKDAFGSIVWHINNQGFFYIPTGENWRAKKVFYHVIGTPQSDDILIYEEKDQTFSVNIGLSSSERYMFITTKSGNNSETWYLDLENPNAKLTVILPRKRDHLYHVTHHGNYFYILTNDKGKNYRLVRAETQSPTENWKEIIEHNHDVYLMDVTAYKNHIVVEKKILGLTQIQIIRPLRKLASGSRVEGAHGTEDRSVLNIHEDLSTGATSQPAAEVEFPERSIEVASEWSKEIHFKDEVYDAYHIFTTFDSPAVRYQYSSLVQPRSIMEYEFTTSKSTQLKIQEIPSGYDTKEYQTKRVWAISNDGVKVPISILYRKDLFTQDGSNPLYLYGYGSYGIAIPPSFRTTALSLVNRGFVFAIAHIRGGDDLGYDWYESAKFLTKKRTFEDFIACAKSLIEHKYTSKGQIAICGGSAGGMLMGYCANNAPELYKAIIMHVPFIDVLETMLDETLPLTPLEFEEWGNPKDPAYYDYIKSYSPFDNITAQSYPNIFITSGLNDPRVGYWEPTKFALKVRDYKKDNNLLLLKTNMDAGHQGKSGRYDSLKEVAEEYIFILKTFGKL